MPAKVDRLVLREKTEIEPARRKEWRARLRALYVEPAGVKTIVELAASVGSPGAAGSTSEVTVAVVME
jgi:hypothetical protein